MLYTNPTAFKLAPSQLQSTTQAAAAEVQLLLLTAIQNNKESLYRTLGFPTITPLPLLKFLVLKKWKEV